MNRTESRAFTQRRNQLDDLAEFGIEVEPPVVTRRPFDALAPLRSHNAVDWHLRRWHIGLWLRMDRQCRNCLDRPYRACLGAPEH